MIRKDFALSAEQRADARAALLLLDGSGMSLTDAVRKALHGRRALRRVSVETAADEFLRTRLINGNRSRTVDWYEQKLNAIVSAFGERRIDDIDRPQINAWLNSLEVSAGTRAGLARCARALWRWAATQDPPLVSMDATAGLKTVGPTNRGEAHFLTVPDAKKILDGSGPYRSALALLLFAGIRPEEVAGTGKPLLLWKHVREAEKMIRIPSEIAKTGKPRIIEGLPETLWHWLQRPAGAQDNDPISPGRTTQLVRRSRALLGGTWPHDATRHTFATYALAFTGDPGKVALWLGHEGNPTMLHRHYRGLATKADGDTFFALRPSS
jgi:integrase